MDVLYCKIHNLTIVFLFVYFLPIVVGPLGVETSGFEPSSDEPSGDEPSVIEPSGAEPPGVELSGVEHPSVELTFESVDHQKCYYNILKVFRIGDRYVNNRQSYLSHAVLHLRLPKKGNRRVLCDCEKPHQFAKKYYRFISNNFVKELPEELNPEVFCGGNGDINDEPEEVERINSDALWYFGFEGSMESIIEYAYWNIVVSDILKEKYMILDMTNDWFYRGGNTTYPENKFHASLYMFKIANNLKINESTMKTPFEYCKNPV